MTPGGQEKVTKKTRERNQEDTRRGHQKDKKRTQGWPARPKDNTGTIEGTRRTRGGQNPDIGAKDCGQRLFLRS